MQRIRVSLGLPPAIVGPNGRGHWAKKSAAVKQCRSLAAWSIRIAMGGGGVYAPWSAATMQIRWVAAKGPLPDDDNVIGRCKAYRDSAMDAGLVVDDRAITVLPPIIERGSPAWVELTFEKGVSGAWPALGGSHTHR